MCLTKAEEVSKRTDEVINYLASMRDKVLEVTGGLTEEGKYADAGGYDKQMAYTLGPGDSKNGAAYELEDQLNSYITYLNTVDSSLSLSPIALSGEEMEMYAKDPDQKNKDFAEITFGNTPTVAVMTILTELKSEVVQAEAKALEALAAQVGADQLKFDKIIAVVKPQSNVVAAGTKYEAEMFIAASSTAAKPRMTFNGKPVTVEDGRGKVSFTASGGDYDAQGNLKKRWNGAITITGPFGDTTFTVDEEYIVAKPVIQIQSASVQALYYNAGNELNVQVPALGNVYNPSFSVDGGKVITSGKKGLITIVPKSKEVTMTLRNDGTVIGKETFKVRPIPKPELVLIAGGKKLNLKQGVDASQMPRSLSLKAVADKDFAAMLPKEARYRTAAWEVTLARGKRPIGSTKKVSGDDVNITDFAREAKPGDRLVIEVKAVQRRNFQNDTENVPGMAGEIFTVPIN